MRWLCDRKILKPSGTRNVRVLTTEGWVYREVQALKENECAWVHMEHSLFIFPGKTITECDLSPKERLRTKALWGMEKGMVGKRGNILKSLLAFKWRQDQRDVFIKLVIIIIGDNLNTWLAPMYSKKAAVWLCLQKLQTIKPSRKVANGPDFVKGSNSIWNFNSSHENYFAK